MRFITHKIYIYQVYAIIKLWLCKMCIFTIFMRNVFYWFVMISNLRAHIESFIQKYFITCFILTLRICLLQNVYLIYPRSKLDERPNWKCSVFILYNINTNQYNKKINTKHHKTTTKCVWKCFHKLSIIKYFFFLRHIILMENYNISTH